MAAFSGLVEVDGLSSNFSSVLEMDLELLHTLSAEQLPATVLCPPGGKVKRRIQLGRLTLSSGDKVTVRSPQPSDFDGPSFLCWLRARGGGSRAVVVVLD